MRTVTLSAHQPFSWDEALTWLSRSSDESLFLIEGKHVIFPLILDEAAYHVDNDRQ